jgi:Domain of Unknown Function (DUF1080)
MKWFRFATVLCLSALSIATSVRAQEGSTPAPKGKMIFDGTTLKGWSGLPANWRVEDGAITGESLPDAPLKNNTFLVYEKKFGDFELNCEFKIMGGNSGIQYRSKLVDAEKFIVGGYQADIDSQKDFKQNSFVGINYEERGRGILVQRGQIVSVGVDGKLNVVGSTGDSDALRSKFKVDDWNTYRVVANGNICQHYINGVLMSELQDHQWEKRASDGIIALQLHAGPPMKVQFKNIYISE